MTVYRVTGRRMYREHNPGETFETTLPAAVEARALEVGAIEIVDASTVTLQPGTFTTADGWPHQPNPARREMR